MKSFLPVLLATLAFASITSAQVSGDIRDGNHMAPPAGAFQDYPGALEAGNYCTSCGFENKTDAPISGPAKARNRFLVNNDRDSINARCRELGWNRGEALQWYSYEEWCRYKNARTRIWDRNNRQWAFGACRDGNVKLARCFRR